MLESNTLDFPSNTCSKDGLSRLNLNALRILYLYFNLLIDEKTFLSVLKQLGRKVWCSIGVLFNHKSSLIRFVQVTVYNCLQ